MRNEQREDRPLSPGTNVPRDGCMPEELEYGVVMRCWLDDGIGFHHCYVAFSGSASTSGKPDEKPCVLRTAQEALKARPRRQVGSCRSPFLRRRRRPDAAQRGPDGQ
jgi:hypothetical protein